MTDIEDRWGVDRLPELVDHSLRERFYKQRERLDAAIQANVGSEVQREAEVMLKGYKHLIKAAEANGFGELVGEVWEAQMPDGRVLAIAKTRDEANKAARDNRDIVVYSIDEIARVLCGWEEFKLATTAKHTFPVLKSLTCVSERQELEDDELLSEFKRPYSVCPFRLLLTVSLKETDLRVLMALCAFTNRAGVCWPSMATLMELTDLKSRTSIDRSMRKLKKLKYVRQLEAKDYQKTKTGWKTNRYQVLWEVDMALPSLEEVHIAKPLQLVSDQDEVPESEGGLGCKPCMHTHAEALAHGFVRAVQQATAKCCWSTTWSTTRAGRRQRDSRTSDRGHADCVPRSPSGETGGA